MQLQPTHATSGSPVSGKTPRTWVEVPMSDVYQADVDRGSPQAIHPEIGLFRAMLGGGGQKRTDFHWKMTNEGVGVSDTAWKALDTLKSRRNSSCLKAALGAAVGAAGLGVLGWQGVQLAQHVLTPGAASLLSVSLGSALQSTGIVVGGLVAWAMGKGLCQDSLARGRQMKELSQELRTLATAAITPKTETGPVTGPQEVRPNLVGPSSVSPILAAIYSRGPGA